MNGLTILGTDTDVGKTFVACKIIEHLLRKGSVVGAYKPVASGAASLEQSDGHLLWQATGRLGQLEEVTPQLFSAPLAPPIAAEMEGKTVSANLIREGAQAWLGKCELLLVEGAGGLMSPLTWETTNAVLASRFTFPIVLVSSNRLGVVNQVLTALQAAKSLGLHVSYVVLNDVKPQSDQSSATNDRLLSHFLAEDPSLPLLTRLRNNAQVFEPAVDWLELANRQVEHKITDSHVPRRSLGMTLVELLVVMAIVGILVGLLLPAVQSAREAARKIQCQNNLRQVGLSLHNYNDAIGSLPPGCLQWRPWGGDPRLKNFAWSAMILPYMEQTNLHRLVDFDYPFDHAVNSKAGKTPVGTYLCPSVPTRETARGRTDYGGLYGQRITTRNQTDNGVLIYNHPIRFREIIDGLTNTLAVAEDSGGPDGEWINGNNVFEQSGGINDPRAWIGDNEIRSKHGGGAMLLFCCGRTQFVSDSTDLGILAAIITRGSRDLGGIE